MKPLFKPEDRLIFEYPDFETGKILYADPMAIQYGLLILTQVRFDEYVAKQKPKNTAVGNIDPPKPEDEIIAMSVRLELAKAMIKVLGYEETKPTKPGVTYTYALKVLQEYMDFVETKKERAESLIRSPKQPSAPCSSPTMDAMSPMPLIADVENLRVSTGKP